MTRTFAVAVLAGMLSLLADGAAGDTVLFDVTATSGGVVGTAHVFGWQDGASDAVDAFDVAEPPGPPEPRFTAVLAMSGSGIPEPNRWRADIRSPLSMGDGRESWILVLESAAPGATCVLTFAPEGPDAGGYTLEVVGPGVRGTIPVTGTFNLPLPTSTVVATITVQAGGVRSERSTWSAIRALLR